jgi:hypothetical protein
MNTSKFDFNCFEFFCTLFEAPKNNFEFVATKETHSTFITFFNRVSRLIYFIYSDGQSFNFRLISTKTNFLGFEQLINFAVFIQFTHISVFSWFIINYLWNQMKISYPCLLDLVWTPHCSPYLSVFKFILFNANICNRCAWLLFVSFPCLH